MRSKRPLLPHAYYAPLAYTRQPFWFLPEKDSLRITFSAWRHPPERPAKGWCTRAAARQRRPSRHPTCYTAAAAATRELIGPTGSKPPSSRTAPLRSASSKLKGGCVLRLQAAAQLLGAGRGFSLRLRLTYNVQRVATPARAISEGGCSRARVSGRAASGPVRRRPRPIRSYCPMSTPTNRIPRATAIGADSDGFSPPARSSPAR